MTGSEVLQVTLLQAVTVREKELSRATSDRCEAERVGLMNPSLEEGDTSVGVRSRAMAPSILMV